MRKRYLAAGAIALAVAALAMGAVKAGAFDERDKIAPVTTTDLAPLYWNDVAISAHATDDAGVAYVYYEFDGDVARTATIAGAPTDTAVSLRTTPADQITPSPDPSVTPQPHELNDPSAAGSHKLTYWAQDVNGNVGERQTVEYTVGKDTQAPVTEVTGAKDGGWYPSWVRVNLACADVGASGLAQFWYARDGGTPGYLGGPTAQAMAAVYAIDGAHTVTYQATDVAGNVEGPVTITVNVDTHAPQSWASNATVLKGRTATLRYKVTDAAPNGGTAAVVIKIRTNSGRVVKTLRAASVPVDVERTAKFKCTLARGRYSFTVYATDTAGNAEARWDAAIGTLRVK